jgi:hypothetical protein
MTPITFPDQAQEREGRRSRRIKASAKELRFFMVYLNFPSLKPTRLA